MSDALAILPDGISHPANTVQPACQPRTSLRTERNRAVLSDPARFANDLPAQNARQDLPGAGRFARFR